MKIITDDTYAKITFKSINEDMRYVFLLVGAVRWYRSKLYAAVHSTGWEKPPVRPCDFYPAFLGEIHEVKMIQLHSLPVEKCSWGHLLTTFPNNGNDGCVMSFEYLRPSSRDIADHRGGVGNKFYAYNLRIKAQEFGEVDKSGRKIYVTNERQLFTVGCLYSGNLYNKRAPDSIIEPDLII